MVKIIFSLIFFFSINTFAGLSELEGTVVILGVGVGANIAIGKIFKAKCGTGQAWGCMLGTMAFTIAAMQLIDLEQSQNSSKGYTCPGCYGGDWGKLDDYSLDGRGRSSVDGLSDSADRILNPKNGADTSSGLNLGGGANPENILEYLLEKDTDQVRNEINKELADLKKKGYTLKNSTLNTPQGQVNPESLNSDAGLKAAGFSDADIAAFNAAKKKAETLSKRMNEKVQRGLRTGAFVGRSNRQKKVDREYKMQIDKYLKDLLGKKNGPASVVGLSQQYGQDKIGVKTNNIFEMVSRRYKAQRRENHFLPFPQLQSKKTPITE